MKRIIILLLLPLLFGCSKNLELEEVFNENVTVEEVEKDPIEEGMIQTRSPIALKDLYGRKIQLKSSFHTLHVNNKGDIIISGNVSSKETMSHWMLLDGYPVANDRLVKAGSPNDGQYLRANGLYPNLAPQISIFSNQNFYLKEVSNSDYYLIVAKVPDMNGGMPAPFKEVYLHNIPSKGATIYDYIYDPKYAYFSVEVIYP